MRLLPCCDLPKVLLLLVYRILDTGSGVTFGACPRGQVWGAHKAASECGPTLFPSGFQSIGYPKASTCVGCGQQRAAVQSRTRLCRLFDMQELCSGTKWQACTLLQWRPYKHKIKTVLVLLSICLLHMILPRDGEGSSCTLFCSSKRPGDAQGKGGMNVVLKYWGTRFSLQYPKWRRVMPPQPTSRCPLSATK